MVMAINIDGMNYRVGGRKNCAVKLNSDVMARQNVKKVMSF